MNPLPNEAAQQLDLDLFTRLEAPPPITIMIVDATRCPEVVNVIEANKEGSL